MKLNLISEILPINNVSAKEHVKQPKPHEETLFWDFLGSFDLFINP